MLCVKLPAKRRTKHISFTSVKARHGTFASMYGNHPSAVLCLDRTTSGPARRSIRYCLEQTLVSNVKPLQGQAQWQRQGFLRPRNFTMAARSWRISTGRRVPCNVYPCLCLPNHRANQKTSIRREHTNERPCWTSNRTTYHRSRAAPSRKRLAFRDPKREIAWDEGEVHFLQNNLHGPTAGYLQMAWVFNWLPQARPWCHLQVR